MQTVRTDKDQIAVAVEAPMGRFCALLRSVPNPNVRAVGTWTVRDVAAHLAGGTRLYIGNVHGEGSPYTRLDGIADFNAAGVAAIPDRDCKALVDRLQSAVADFVAAVRTTPGDPEEPGTPGSSCRCPRLPLSFSAKHRSTGTTSPRRSGGHGHGCACCPR